MWWSRVRNQLGSWIITNDHNINLSLVRSYTFSFELKPMICKKNGFYVQWSEPAVWKVEFTPIARRWRLVSYGSSNKEILASQFRNWEPDMATSLLCFPSVVVSPCSRSVVISIDHPPQSPTPQQFDPWRGCSRVLVGSLNIKPLCSTISANNVTHRTIFKRTLKWKK